MAGSACMHLPAYRTYVRAQHAMQAHACMPAVQKALDVTHTTSFGDASIRCKATGPCCAMRRQSGGIDAMYACVGGYAVCGTLNAGQHCH